VYNDMQCLIASSPSVKKLCRWLDSMKVIAYGSATDESTLVGEHQAMHQYRNQAL
jgi:hypothetical protein